jgi:hypothetical protein
MDYLALSVMINIDSPTLSTGTIIKIKDALALAYVVNNPDYCYD